MEKFEMHLRQDNMADNTITAYKHAVNEFNGRYKEVNKKNLLLYKAYLIENFKPKTVNQRIQAINKYLDYMDKPHLRLKSVKAQQKSFLENVISNADYIFLKNKMKEDGATRALKRHVSTSAGQRPSSRTLWIEWWCGSCCLLFPRKASNS